MILTSSLNQHNECGCNNLPVPPWLGHSGVDHTLRDHIDSAAA